jgi:thioredoxin
MKDIQTFDEMMSLIEKSGTSLIAFDLYADWCGPCRMLSPTLDSIALEKKTAVTFFRVNVDRVPQAAQAFQIQGIPFVVFVRNGKPVGVLVGLRQKSDYVYAIDEYGASQK